MKNTQFLTRALALITAVGAFAVTAPAGVPGSPQAAGAVVGDCAPGADWGTPRQDLTARVTELVNQHRASLGLSQLTVSTTLTNASVWKARHMAKYVYMTHNDPAPPVARTTAERLQACGYPTGSAGWGENIAYGYATADAVMQGWLGSAGHRANIENATYRSIGVGAASSSTGRIYWAQAFGTQAGSGSTPPPPPAAACSNRVDDDGDGKVDYPADPGCTSAGDTDEYNAPAPAPVPPPATLTGFPSILTLTAGAFQSGGVSSLGVDDGVYFRVASSGSTVSWWGRITGVPNTLTSLSTTYRGFNSSACTQTLSIWNWRTAAWTSLGSRSVGPTEVETKATPTGTLADYVSGTTGNGDVAVAVSCAGPLLSTFSSSAELLKISYGS
ncbi:MAG: hypothetical protein QOJ43_1632 [Gaiellaceae bacterium]|jgi:uncharacterized protein YkwD|nr:hypothetical protein [Gaiellaceae bacterium]